jgi:hypothetical protein
LPLQIVFIHAIEITERLEASRPLWAAGERVLGFFLFSPTSLVDPDESEIAGLLLGLAVDSC